MIKERSEKNEQKTAKFQQKAKTHRQEECVQSEVCAWYEKYIFRAGGGGVWYAQKLETH